MYVGPQKQRGMTGLGWLTVLFIIGFFSFLALKLVPIYLEYYSIKQVLYSLKNEPAIAEKSAAEVRTLIGKRLLINSIYNLDKDTFKIKKVPGKFEVELNHNVQKHMAGNIDVLVTFHDEIDLANP